MDFVTFARQSFFEACENLVVACELDDNIEPQAALTRQQLHVVCLAMSRATFALRMMRNLLKIYMS
jgi:hypothetical protein